MQLRAWDCKENRSPNALTVTDRSRFTESLVPAGMVIGTLGRFRKENIHAKFDSAFTWVAVATVKSLRI